MHGAGYLGPSQSSQGLPSPERLEPLDGSRGAPWLCQISGGRARERCRRCGRLARDKRRVLGDFSQLQSSSGAIRRAAWQRWSITIATEVGRVSTLRCSMKPRTRSDLILQPCTFDQGRAPLCGSPRKGPEQPATHHNKGGVILFGLKGTMNALFLKDLAQKTRRGLLGRVLQGRSGGGLCYGYDLVRGEVGVRRINENKAKIVRSIFHDYAAGQSPRAIARQLNERQILGPSGRPWRDTAIRGHFTRGTGILNNELYVGRLVWNRLVYLKDPASGRRRSRLNSPDQWVVQEVPALRIIDDSLWEAVKARQSSVRESDGVVHARATRFWEHRRSRHLLSGLLYCQECGSGYASIGRDYVACSSSRGGGTCSNRQSNPSACPGGADC